MALVQNEILANAKLRVLTSYFRRDHHSKLNYHLFTVGLRQDSHSVRSVTKG